MLYITKRQFESLAEHFNVERVECYVHSSFRQYEPYSFDYIYEVRDITEIIAYVFVIINDNITLFTIDFLCDSYKSVLNTFSSNSCLILTKGDIHILFGDTDISHNFWRDKLEDVEKMCKKNSLHSKCIPCGEICSINIHSDIKVSRNMINEYLYGDFISESRAQYNIYSCENREVFFQIQCIFNTIQFFYQLRTVNKVKVVSEGNGYVFFETGNYIVGYQKFYNYWDSPLTYYLFNTISENIYVFATNNSDRQVLRLCQAILARHNANQGGINLHASAAVYNNRAIILTGDKESGKTTNLLFGLKYYKNLKFMSNDIIHLVNKGEDIYALGSPRKVSIRASTIDLFDELAELSYNEYDSVGNTDSKNIHFVKRIEDITNLFGVGVQFYATVGLVVFVQYAKELKEPAIELVNYEEAVDMFIKQEHAFYNGREKFWDEILKCKSIDNFSILKKTAFIKVKMSKENSKATWERIIAYV